MRVSLLWSIGALLVVLHLFPPVGEADPGAAPHLVLGHFPVELAYRLAWMAMATLFVVVVTARPKVGEP